MNRFSLMLIMVGFLSFASTAPGQTTQSQVLKKPCAGDELPGRPALKLRATTPDNTTAPSDTEPKAPKAEPPCEPSSKQQAAEVKFEGLSAIPESDLRKLLREHRVALPQKLDTASDLVEKAEEAITGFLSARGYRHAKVASRFEKVGEAPAVLTFVINEGLRFGISEIRFEGNKVFPSQLLAAKMKEYLARYQEAEPDRFDEEVFEYCVHRLTNFERAQGYLQARFDATKVAELGGGLILTLRVEEGVLYRLGKIEIEGANVIAPERVLAMLEMRRGDVANGERISKCFYEDLKEFYGEKGFIQYSAEIQPEFKLKPGGSEGVVDFTIGIDEGRAFKLRKISFEGAGNQTEELRQLLLIREGDVFNQRLFESSIRRLNEIGLFEFVDKDKDVDYRTNDEEGLFDLVIKVAKREG